MNYPKIERLHPEIGAGLFTGCDGTIAFYARVDALVTPHTRMLDLAPGGAAYAQDKTCACRRKLRDFRGRVAEVIACNVDEAVLTNPAVDRSFLIEAGKPIPLDKSSLDMILTDHVNEQIEDPAAFSNEIDPCSNRAVGSVRGPRLKHTMSRWSRACCGRESARAL